MHPSLAAAEGRKAGLMDFIGELLLTALLAIGIVAVLVFVGWTLIIVGAALIMLAVAWWHVCRRIVAKCAACWRCMIACALLAGSVFGGVPAAAFVAWAASSGSPIESYDRLEERPADAYLGNRYLSASGDFAVA